LLDDQVALDEAVKLVVLGLLRQPAVNVIKKKFRKEKFAFLTRNKAKLWQKLCA
jgi:hypothetical protein